MVIHFEDIHCIPFNDKVLEMVAGRLHSEVDAFEVCQAYRERSRYVPGLWKVENIVDWSLEAVGLAFEVGGKIEGMRKRVPNTLELVETMR